MQHVVVERGVTDGGKAKCGERGGEERSAEEAARGEKGKWGRVTSEAGGVASAFVNVEKAYTWPDCSCTWSIGHLAASFYSTTHSYCHLHPATSFCLAAL